MLSFELRGIKFLSNVPTAKLFYLEKIGGSKSELGSGLFFDISFHISIRSQFVQKPGNEG